MVQQRKMQASAAICFRQVLKHLVPRGPVALRGSSTQYAQSSCDSFGSVRYPAVVAWGQPLGGLLSPSSVGRPALAGAACRHAGPDAGIATCLRAIIAAQSLRLNPRTAACAWSARCADSIGRACTICGTCAGGGCTGGGGGGIGIGS